MPELKLLCDRPHAKTIDFSAARLVVCTASGLNVNGQKLAMGEEIPQGALSADALRCEYEPPLRRVELLDFAMKDPDLRDAIIRHRTSEAPLPPVEQPSPAPKKREVRPDLDVLTRRELSKLCHDFKLSENGTKTDLQQRLRAHYLGR